MSIGSTSSVPRQQHIDFLRGLAIILVLFRHKFLCTYTTTMGWIGVDLFFVLSGFLVSGLLFREYKTYGKINAIRFLIRRGFKIYPVFYITLATFVVYKLAVHEFAVIPFLSEVFFMQNYLLGFGWAFNGVSWSLAVEEHFYFGLAFLLPLLFKIGIIDTKRMISNYKFELFVLFVFIGCLLLRLLSNYYFPYQPKKNMTMTHLRIDSMFAGVLISYWYHLKPDLLKSIFARIKFYIFPLLLLLLSFTPFIEPLPSFFVKTIGFTMLYVAFALLLLYFIQTEDMTSKLNRFLSKPVIRFIAMTGTYSYSIYIVHTFVNTAVKNWISTNVYVGFLLSFFLSIFAGLLMSLLVENTFLRLREKYFPAVKK